MIQSIMLVVLGFLVASLIALLLAPSLWRRAARLTTRRLEQSMPMSIADIEADRDQLRANYAIMIRRLEAALSQEKMLAARYLVQISRLQMEIASLKDQAASMRSTLDAHHNAATVLQRTIATRVPELDRAASEAYALLDVRDKEVRMLINRLKRREENLAIAHRTTEMQQSEIARLRQSMEMSGAQNSGRFKKGPSKWTIHDYRAEYDRLNVDLSKMRERLAVAYDREAHQINVLKTELQQLAERIVNAAKDQDVPANTDALPAGRHARVADEASARVPEARAISALLSGLAEAEELSLRNDAGLMPAATARQAAGAAAAEKSNSARARLAMRAAQAVSGWAGATMSRTIEKVKTVASASPTQSWREMIRNDGADDGAPADQMAISGDASQKAAQHTPHTARPLSEAPRAPTLDLKADEGVPVSATPLDRAEPSRGAHEADADGVGSHDEPGDLYHSLRQTIAAQRQAGDRESLAAQKARKTQVDDQTKPEPALRSAHGTAGADEHASPEDGEDYAHDTKAAADRQIDEAQNQDGSPDNAQHEAQAEAEQDAAARDLPGPDAPDDTAGQTAKPPGKQEAKPDTAKDTRESVAAAGAPPGAASLLARLRRIPESRSG